MRSDLYTNGSVDLPKIKKGRSFFDLTHSNSCDMNVGVLYPIDQAIQVVPGDTFDYSHRLNIRMTNPPKTPTFGTLAFDIYWFYTPNRILWRNWDRFITGNYNQGYNVVTPSMPVVDIQNSSLSSANNILKDLHFSVLDYLGFGNLSIIGTGATGLFNPQLLPVRAYYYCWNEFFRYESLQKEVLIDFDDTSMSYLTYAPVLSNIQVSSFYNLNLKTNDSSIYNHLMSKKYFGLALMPVNRLPGYFSRCLPQPQAGSDVKILENLTLSSVTTINSSGSTITGSLSTGATGLTAGGTNASLKSNNVGGESNTIRALSNAFALNKFLYIDNVYGQRITEWTYGHFGVNVPDGRVQRPEYLAKKRVYINVNQIIQSSETTQTSPQGNAGAWSQTYDSGYDFAKSFVEYGFLLTLGCIRVLNHTFSQGIDKFWSYRSKFDYYLPEFNNTGDETVFTDELYPAVASGQSNHTAFGYQERYAHLKMIPSKVCGYMRPGITGSLAIWNYADLYSSAPTLSATWMMEPRDNVDRTLFFSQDTAPAFILDYVADIKAYRTMPYHSIPGGLTGSW